MLQIGAVYNHPEHGKIYITSGQYMGGYDRISNFWNWKKVNKNGSLSKRSYCGYGGQWKRVEVEVIINIKEK